MIEIHLDPNLLRLGPVLITWHGLFTALGVLVGVWLAARLVRGTPLTEDQIYNAALWAIPGGIVGARLLFVLEKPYLFAANPISVLYINEGGISIYGAILGGTLAGVIGARVMSLPVGKVADAAGPGFTLGQAIGRIGDIINGEHHATATDLPWAVLYTHPATLGERGVPVHPAVAYEGLWNLAILGILMALRRRSLPEGLGYLLYLSLYSFGRFFISFLRKDDLILFDLRQAQLIALLVLLVTVPWLIALARRRAAAQAESRQVRRARRR